jgi:hypothetical protein
VLTGLPLERLPACCPPPWLWAPVEALPGLPWPPPLPPPVLGLVPADDSSDEVSDSEPPDLPEPDGLEVFPPLDDLAAGSESFGGTFFPGTVGTTGSYTAPLDS